MNKLRVGYIGWLDRDDGENCETVAWCDCDSARLQGLKSQNPDIAMYADYRELLRHPSLDVVVIATPNWLHCEMACASLEAGKHVFIEKPMGINRREIDLLLQTALCSGKNFAIDFEMRMSPFAKRIKQLLDSGEFGELCRLECIHHRGGWLEEGNGIWRTRPDQSGGLFLMEPIHIIDIFRFFAGDVTAVQAVSGPNVLTNYRFPDNVCAHLFFKNKVQGTILTTHTLSAQVNGSADLQEFGHDMHMIFTCTKGTISVDFLRGRILINRYETYPPDTNGTRVVFDRIEEYGGDNHSFFHDIALMRRDFLRRCANAEPPLQAPIDAWKTHLVCLAAEESATNGATRMVLDYNAEGIPPA
jgi:predicted dehydrogenase